VHLVCLAEEEYTRPGQIMEGAIDDHAVPVVLLDHETIAVRDPIRAQRGDRRETGVECLADRGANVVVRVVEARDDPSV